MERLNKWLASAGYGSRRQCDALIAAGRVAVGGVRVADAGHKVEADDEVSVDGNAVAKQRHVYWALNKPKGYLCTNHDPAGRPRAIDLLMHVPERVFTVGRLDEESEGLLLLTNDGELAQRLTHPRFGIEKTYMAQVAGHPKAETLAKLTKGVWMSEGIAKAKRVKLVRAQGDSAWLQIVLAEGKNREIRRMLAKLGHKVLQLERIAIGPIHLDRLKSGKCRKLSLPELTTLRKWAEAAAQPKPKPTAQAGARPAAAKPAAIKGRRR